MAKRNSNSQNIWRSLSVAGVIVGAIAVAPVASAGECPPGKKGVNDTRSGPMEPKGVTDKVLHFIDLSRENVKLNDHLFRMRRLEIQPGGIVPWHSHGDRPALIYIIDGQVTEYSSNCAVPIEHMAGEAAMESVGLSHWWKNNGRRPAVLISADILHTKKEKGDTM